MRIISGKMKGSLLFLPPNKNTRPLKDMTKESIFNLLIHSNKISFQIEKSNILDLYSGIGSFGLECISRNAKSVYFVENKKDVVEILEKNINKLKINNKAKIYCTDVLSFIKKKINFTFDIIFCDPPFASNDIENLVKFIYINKLLSKNGILIIHRKKNSKDNLPNYFNLIDERIYGLSKIIYGNF
tara:strand:- start:388 stop:945 length:558 start_codon:yes stop_codon:yes gene_type:complete